LAHPPFRDRTAAAVHRDRKPVAAVLLPRRRGGSIHRWAPRRPAAAPASERGSRPTHRSHDGVETTNADGGISVRQRAPSIDIGTGSQFGAGPATIALPSQGHRADELRRRRRSLGHAQRSPFDLPSRFTHSGPGIGSAPRELPRICRGAVGMTNGPSINSQILTDVGSRGRRV
jgi:hypothetical protein